MFRNHTVPIQLVAFLALQLLSAASVRADCWYFSYRYQGAGPYNLGPYSSKSAANRVASDLAQKAKAMRHSFSLISVKDYCGGTNPGGTNPGGTNPGGTNPGGTNPGGGQNDCSLVSVQYYKLSYSGPGNGVIGNYCCRNVAQAYLDGYKRVNPRFKFTITAHDYPTYSGGSNCQSKNTIQCVNGQVREVPYSGTIYQWRCN